MSAADNKKGGASLQRTFSDFEPYCKWRRDDQSENLQVHLQDFKKDNLRVQLNNRGILTIIGERSLGGDRYSRFRKEIQLSNDCDMDKVRAKFSGGVLNVTMPKKATDDVGEKEATRMTVQRLKPSNKSGFKIVGLLLTLLATFEAYVAYRRCISINQLDV